MAIVRHAVRSEIANVEAGLYGNGRLSLYHNTWNGKFRLRIIAGNLPGGSVEAGLTEEQLRELHDDINQILDAASKSDRTGG